MNKLTFDNVVSRDPKAFAFVTTPDPPADLRSTSGNGVYVLFDLSTTVLLYCRWKHQQLMLLLSGRCFER